MRVFLEICHKLQRLNRFIFVFVPIAQGKTAYNSWSQERVICSNQIIFSPHIIEGMGTNLRKRFQSRAGDGIKKIYIYPNVQYEHLSMETPNPTNSYHRGAIRADPKDHKPLPWISLAIQSVF
jgi:hypothetical protein